jgi:hypothetical protein
MPVLVAGAVLLTIPMEEPVLSAFLQTPPTACQLVPETPGAAEYCLIIDCGAWALGQPVRVTFADHSTLETVIQAKRPVNETGVAYALAPAGTERTANG